MKQNIKSVIVLTSICLVVALLLAVTNHFTKDKIAENNAQSAYEACYDVMPDAKGFEEVDLSSFTGLPTSLTNAYKETSGLGYTYKLVVTGKNPGLTIMVGIDSKGIITNTKVVASQETPSYFGGVIAEEYANKFAGKDSTLAGIELISGATLSSKAYKSAVSDAFNANAIIAGMEVVKSKEMLIAEVLKDTLSVKELTIEGLTIENVNAIYASDQYDGYAVEVVINEINYYIGFSYSGNVLGLSASSTDELSEGFTLDKEATNDTETALLNVVNKINENKSIIANKLFKEEFNKVLKAETTVVAYTNSFELPSLSKTISYYPVPEYPDSKVEKNITSSVIAVFETENSYIYFTKSSGNNGAVVLLIAIDKEGALIDTYTIYQKETPSYTSNIWTDNYQDKFHGITSIPEEGIIQSNATVTSTAYSLAVKCAFETYKLMGGNN